MQSLVYSLADTMKTMQVQMQDNVQANKMMQESVSSFQDNIQHSIQQVQERLDMVRNQNEGVHPTTNNSSSPHSSSSLADSLLKGIKLEIPKFTGEDALG